MGQKQLEQTSQTGSATERVLQIAKEGISHVTAYFSPSTTTDTGTAAKQPAKPKKKAPPTPAKAVYPAAPMHPESAYCVLSKKWKRSGSCRSASEGQ